METSRLLERERKWGTRAGLSAIAGAIAALAGFFLLQSALGGDTNYEGLLEAHEKISTIWLSGLATALGYLLLAGPMLYLFRAAQGRSERVRNQFVGLVVLGPVLLGLAGIGLAAGTQEAGNTYVDGKAESTLTVREAKSECRGDHKGESAKECVHRKREEDRASNAITDSSIVTASQLIGFAGGISLVIALFYTCLWCMRTGLLPRFWGSLGMAVGVVALIGLTPLVLLWFLYLGLLLVGRIPGGKPPAWDAGEAIPWPSAGEKAAAELEGPGGQQAGDDDGVAGDGVAPGIEGPPVEGERRKRKQRED